MRQRSNGYAARPSTAVGRGQVLGRLRPTSRGELCFSLYLVYMYMTTERLHGTRKVERRHRLGSICADCRCALALECGTRRGAGRAVKEALRDERTALSRRPQGRHRCVADCRGCGWCGDRCCGCGGVLYPQAPLPAPAGFRRHLALQPDEVANGLQCVGRHFRWPAERWGPSFPGTPHMRRAGWAA